MQGAKEDMLANVPRLISGAENLMLYNPITEEEVLSTIWGLNPDKALGPNRFTISFSQECWHVIKSGLCKIGGANN